MIHDGRDIARADGTYSAGQTWDAVSDTRHIELVTSNAEGETLIGYQGETGTALATESEFAAWVRDEAATPE